MRLTNMKNLISKTNLLLALMSLMLLLSNTVYAAVPGITGTTFNLTAQPAYLNQPDGSSVYSWGYGCNGAPAGGFLPTQISGAACPSMQVPGPTLIVHENDVVTVTLTNGLPTAAGNTSILFPGFNVCAATLNASTGACTGTATGVTGLLTQEAAPAGTVTYTFVANAPGTHPYYSGTQGDLQVEMGLYGALIVLPASVPANCDAGYHAQNVTAQGIGSQAHPGVLEKDFRLAHAAYDHPGSCYDREYLSQ